jgi:hypothetical protein
MRSGRERSASVMRLAGCSTSLPRPRVETRQRNVRRHRTTNNGPRVLEFASEMQKAVYEYGPFPCVASGGFNATKTTAFVWKVIEISHNYPNNRGVIARRVAKELKETTMASFYKWVPEQLYLPRRGTADVGKRSDSENYLRFNNGSEVLFMHMDDPETENVIRGLEINWFFIDQAEEIEEEIFDLLMLRLGRWDKTTVPPEVLAQHPSWPWHDTTGRPIPPTYPMLTCNPDHELHWIYRRFHPDSPEHHEKRFFDEETGRLRSYKDLGYRMFQMNTLENKFLTKQQRSLLLSKDEMYQRRYVRGEWGLPEGQIHTVPKESVLEYTPELIDYLTRECTLHRTLDHGDSAPTACLWWAVDRNGSLFAFREYYMPGTLISDHRRNIHSLSGHEQYRFQLADPSIFTAFSQKSGKRWSVANEYADCKSLPRQTALFWSKGDNDELGTRNRINEYLRVDPDRIHPITKEKGSPRLFFVRKSDQYQQGCDHVIRELKSQKRERLGTDNGKPIFSDKRDESVSDHAYDCLRYMIAACPATPTETKMRPSRKTFHGWARMADEFRRRGGWKQLAEETRTSG